MLRNKIRERREMLSQLTQQGDQEQLRELLAAYQQEIMDNWLAPLGLTEANVHWNTDDLKICDQVGVLITLDGETVEIRGRYLGFWENKFFLSPDPVDPEQPGTRYLDDLSDNFLEFGHGIFRTPELLATAIAEVLA